MLDLKICSVSFNAYEYLRINRKLMMPNDVSWLVVKNKKDEKVSVGFDVMDGVYDMVYKENSKIGKASYHHAAAMNKACTSSLLTKRYILFLDPDFFIMPTLETCVNYMKENNLAFFGSPYYIEPTKNRIQDFPVAFCMFVDSQQVDISQLNFTPQETDEAFADTGYGIYKQFKESGLKYEATLPVFKDTTIHACSKTSIKDRYGIAHDLKLDEYFWKDKLFGIHCHMKLHLRDSEEVVKRSLAQTRGAVNIVNHVRKYDSVI